MLTFCQEVIRCNIYFDNEFFCNKFIVFSGRKQKGIRILYTKGRISNEVSSTEFLLIAQICLS